MFGITQVLIQGGHNPNLRIEYYEDAFNTIKRKYPEVGIHGLSASEVDMIAKVERSSTKEVLARLKTAGLDSLPGAGAEILDDSVKAEISPLKIKSHEWLRIMEESHNMGLQSSATMMYGTVESEEQQARHLMIIAYLQSSWLTNGIGMAQLALNYGADDFGGTLIGEEVVSATGAASTELTAQQIIKAVKLVGLDVAERDNFYRTIRKF